MVSLTALYKSVYYYCYYYVQSRYVKQCGWAGVPKESWQCEGNIRQFYNVPGHESGHPVWDCVCHYWWFIANNEGPLQQQYSTVIGYRPIVLAQGALSISKSSDRLCIMCGRDGGVDIPSNWSDLGAAPQVIVFGYFSCKKTLHFGSKCGWLFTLLYVFRYNKVDVTDYIVGHIYSFHQEAIGHESWAGTGRL